MKFNRLIPELTVQHLPSSLKFYINTVGFKIDYRREADRFAFLSYEGAQLMLEERNGNWKTGALDYPYGRGINFQIEVSDLEGVLKAIRGAGYPLMKEPWQSWYQVGEQTLGQREFLVLDPDGYLLRFCEDINGK